MGSILVVDDLAQHRTGVRRIVERLGHEVTEADSGGEAMRALGARRYDLVITDINMPDVDGIELIIATGDRWPGIPIIAISGGGLLPKELLLDSASALGVVQTLPKPLDTEQLRAAIRAALGERYPPEGEPGS